MRAAAGGGPACGGAPMRARRMRRRAHAGAARAHARGRARARPHHRPHARARARAMRRLVGLLEPIDAKVNLIEFNAHAGTEFERSGADAVLAFRSAVIRGGRVCTIRSSRGDDQLAACGQLGDASQALRPARRRGGEGAVGEGGDGGGAVDGGDAEA